MDIKIEKMSLKNLSEYSRLFASVFNSEPWNDSWTEETAAIRIENMINTDTFIGMALYCGGDLKGMIWGQKEFYFNGIHFQIQEFCVKRNEQGKGYGRVLLDELKRELTSMGVVNIYLITQRGESTEGYYRRRGFITSDNMVLMTNAKQG